MCAICKDQKHVVQTLDVYVITPEDRKLISAALKNTAVDYPRLRARAGALAIHIESAKGLTS